MLVGLDVEAAGAAAAECHEVQRRQVAGGVVEEHVLRAGIGAVDAPGGGAGVPLVNGGVVLHAGIGAGPGGVGDAVPQVARLHLLVHAPVRSEEHTSELQSLMRISYAVFCLTKKKQNKQHTNYYIERPKKST